MERFFELVVFNYIYGNGDAHLKNFSLVKQGEDFRLAPAYDLINTSLHLNDSDFGLEGGLSPNIEKSEIYLKTQHPCKVDFALFGLHIGLGKSRIDRILGKFAQLPDEANTLIDNSFLSVKAKRTYKRIVNERIRRFNRGSEPAVRPPDEGRGG